MENTFTQIEGFSKYEMNSNRIIRNIKTKAIVSKDKGGKTIRLINDAGERKTINPLELNVVGAITTTKTKGASNDSAPQKKSAKTKAEKKQPAIVKQRGKLSFDDADEIRRLAAKTTMSRKEIAAKYGIHVSSVSEIISNKMKVRK